MKKYTHYRGIEELLHDLLLRAPNGKSAEAVAEALGKDYFTLVKELLPSNPGHKFAARDLVPLMLATGSDAPVAYLASRMGGMYLSGPKSGAGFSSAGRAAIKAAREFGDVMRVFDAALDDQSEDGADLGERELADLVRETAEAMAAIAAFKGLLLRRYQERTGKDPSGLFGKGEDRG